MRVHELAKEYKVTSKEIIETLKANGEEVKSHLSGLTTDQITKLGYIMQSGDTIVEKEYKEELAEDDDYDEKGPIDFDEQVAEENGTELSMEPEKDGQPDDEEGTDSELSFGQKAFAKAKAEETPVDEIAEVIVEKPKGVWGWFIGLFS